LIPQARDKAPDFGGLSHSEWEYFPNWDMNPNQTGNYFPMGNHAPSLSHVVGKDAPFGVSNTHVVGNHAPSLSQDRDLSGCFFYKTGHFISQILLFFNKSQAAW
jgi:hypothetical protein